METISEEDWVNRYAPAQFGDSALHVAQSRMSRRQWERIVEAIHKKDDGLVEKRERLRAIYRELVVQGKLKAPTRLERLRAIASGNPDRESTQAAIRLLAAEEGYVS